MNLLFRNRNYVRWSAVSVGSLLLILAVYNFYRYAKSPTDENIFQNPPSRISIIRDFPISSAGTDQGQTEIKNGDLLLGINGQKVNDLSQIDVILSGASADEPVTFSVFDPWQNRKRVVSMPVSNIPDSFAVQLPHVVQVIQVTAGGASDQAGMQVGDLIYKINGRTFQNSREADHILQQAQLNKSIVYEVFRRNNLISLHVQLAIAGFRLSRLVALFCGMTFLILGALLIFNRPDYPASRYLGFTGIIFGFYLMAVFSLRAVGTGLFAYIILALVVLSPFISTSLWFISTYYFPEEVKRTSALLRHQKILIILAVLFALFAYLLLLGILVNVPWLRIPWLQDMVRYGIIVNLLFLILLIFAVGNKIRFRKLASDRYKKMRKTLKYAGILTAILMAVLIYLLFNGVTDSAYISAVVMVMPVAYVYTINKYALLDLHIRLRRNIQYSLISLLWIFLLLLMAGYLLVTLSQLNISLPSIRWSGNFVEFVEGQPSALQEKITDRVIFILLGALIGWGIWRIGKVGQRFFREKYYRSRYDYRRAANQMSHMLQTNLDMYSLARELARKLGDMMHLKRVGVLFFRNQSGCCCQEYHGFDGKSWTAYCLQAGDEIIRTVQAFHKVVSINLLPDEMREKFAQAQFQHLIPVRSKDQMLGLILVGEKLSESAFHREDYEFLQSVASQAAISIENAFLYEELREQERIKQELRIARQIQLSSLPQSVPSIAGLDIHGMSQPALEVGGDFFDYMNGDSQELLVIVGDVSGKGISAALYMSKIQGIFRSLQSFNLTPRDLFVRTNRVIRRDLDKTFFVTGLAGKFNPERREVVLVRAGHLPLYHYRAERKKVDCIQSEGLGFGIEQTDEFEKKLQEYKTDYDCGDVFLFATDGVIEAFNSRQQEFGEERLLQALQESADAPARMISDFILKRFNEFIDGDLPHDDTTLVVIKAT
jgi:sigma-B regulation protein RsbU (phosphoserine phosphatase)